MQAVSSGRNQRVPRCWLMHLPYQWGEKYTNVSQSLEECYRRNPALRVHGETEAQWKETWSRQDQSFSVETLPPTRSEHPNRAQEEGCILRGISGVGVMVRVDIFPSIQIHFRGFL